MKQSNKVGKSKHVQGMATRLMDTTLAIEQDVSKQLEAVPQWW